MLEGKATSRAAYERFQTIFSNVRARARMLRTARLVLSPKASRCVSPPICRRRLKLVFRNGRSFPWSLTRPDRFSASSNCSTPPAAPDSSTALTPGSWPSALRARRCLRRQAQRTRWRSFASTTRISRKIRRGSRSSFAPSPCSPTAKVVRVAAGARLDVPMLKALLEAPLAGALVIEAGALRPDSALRKLFEGHKTAAALAELQRRALGLRADRRGTRQGRPQDRQRHARYLMARLGADQAMSRAEVAKLALFARGQGQHQRRRHRRHRRRQRRDRGGEFRL